MVAEESKMKKTHILVIEDEPSIAEVVSLYLRRADYSVEVATDGQVAMDLLSEAIPDLIVMDLMLPKMDGVSLTRWIRDMSDVPIIMLTARREETDRIAGLEMGADDYVVKPFSLREVISRIRALLRRAYGELATPSSGGRLSFGTVVLDLERLQVRRGGQLVYLTPTEFRLLHHLVSNPDRPFGRSELIEVVWGYDSEVGQDRTVDVHMRHLRQKLETNI